MYKAEEKQRLKVVQLYYKGEECTALGYWCSYLQTFYLSEFIYIYILLLEHRIVIKDEDIPVLLEDVQCKNINLFYCYLGPLFLRMY